jgi:lauroyl/myristoyl acyltransferase
VSGAAWWRRFLVRGVVWRQLLRWGILNIPPWVEPVLMAWWSLIFLLWGPGRRGVMRNLAAIKPRSWMVTNFFRTYRVFWNYAWTIADKVRHRELRIIPDWDFIGVEHFDAMQSSDAGSIILTAHMGSYDLGAELLAEFSARRITMVRAPEVDPETQRYEEAHLGEQRVHVGFNTAAGDLAIELLNAVREGQIIAVQGDRVTPGIASIETTLFGKRAAIPSGPFALAMASRAPIYPMFVMRRGRRSYRLLTLAPIVVTRTSRDRDEDIRRAMSEWTRGLEGVIRDAWYQWFAFEPFYEESAA